MRAVLEWDNSSFYKETTIYSNSSHYNAVVDNGSFRVLTGGSFVLKYQIKTSWGVLFFFICVNSDAVLK